MTGGEFGFYRIYVFYMGLGIKILCKGKFIFENFVNYFEIVGIRNFGSLKGKN